MTFCAPHDSNCFVTFHPDDCSRCDMKKSVGRLVERIQLSSISMPFRRKKRRLLRTGTFPSIPTFTTILTKQKERGNGWCARRNPLIVFWERKPWSRIFSLRSSRAQLIKIGCSILDWLVLDSPCDIMLWSTSHTVVVENKKNKK